MDFEEALCIVESKCAASSAIYGGFEYKETFVFACGTEDRTGSGFYMIIDKNTKAVSYESGIWIVLKAYEGDTELLAARNNMIEVYKSKPHHKYKRKRTATALLTVGSSERYDA